MSWNKQPRKQKVTLEVEKQVPASKDMKYDNTSWVHL